MRSVSGARGQECGRRRAGETHIGEKGPPHQGEETRHFGILWGLSTASREGVWELWFKNEGESARLRLQLRQSRKIYQVVDGDRRVPSSAKIWSPSRYVVTFAAHKLTELVLAPSVC